jgi:conjugal transfer pilus assembly protein TrbC
MEKAIMLRFLILIYFSLIAHTTFAEESDQQWAKGVSMRDYKMVMENFKNSMEDKDFDQDLRESVLKPRPILQIFVSSSMSKQSLKSYAREAHRYNGVLVFRGLPSSSFRRLTDLVMDISDEEYPVAMQIDDEAFAQFGIRAVPAIVLTAPAAMFSEQTAKEKFDKVTGHITIKAVLEMFATSGDLADNARELLK